MADFDNVRFPVKVALGAVGGPGFKTSIATVSSGKESRRQFWEHERGQWTVSLSAKRPNEAKQMLAFFRVVGQGMANTFRFKDWADYVCEEGEGVFITNDDSPSLVQMAKRYTFHGIDGTPYTYDRIINKPIEGKITTDASGLDYSNGWASSGTTWHGEFDCWARLGDDAAKVQIITPKPGGYLMSWEGIQIVEVVHEVV